MTEESLLREDTETIVIGPSQRKDYFIFAQPLVGDLAERVYQGVRDKINSQYEKARAFSDHWSFDKKSRMIKGSNPFFGVLVGAELAERGLYLPSVREGKFLDSKKRLSNGVYRDFNLVVYDENKPNKSLAQFLVQDAKTRKMDLPLILPFSALSLEQAENKYGVQFHISDNIDRVVSGADAKTAIASMDYKANSGARRLYRNGYDLWVASWYLLEDSGDGGRVDFVCGEATQKKLDSALQSEISRKYASKRKELEKELQSLADEEKVFTTDAYKVFTQ